jgi:hypothetical protein
LLLGTVGANDGAEEQTAVGGDPKSDYDDDNRLMLDVFRNFED